MSPLKVQPLDLVSFTWNFVRVYLCVQQSCGTLFVSTRCAAFSLLFFQRISIDLCKFPLKW